MKCQLTHDDNARECLDNGLEEEIERNDDSEMMQVVMIHFEEFGFLYSMDISLNCYI